MAIKLWKEIDYNNKEKDEKDEKYEKDEKDEKYEKKIKTKEKINLVVHISVA
jgi:hypothetical protein